jgi:hypothetical protein
MGVPVEEETHGAAAKAKSTKKNEIDTATPIRRGTSQAHGKGQGEGPERFGVFERLRKGLTP